MVEKFNRNQYLSKEAALRCLIILWKWGVIKTDYEPVFNPETKFWELREA